jgi:glycine/D-amino acid oxidase-like deaminating enzyme
MVSKVVVLGGAVAGLSAADELIEGGFDVEAYEALANLGGKARSLAIGGKPGLNGMRKDLPGEHGFRFFPRLRHSFGRPAAPFPRARVCCRPSITPMRMSYGWISCPFVATGQPRGHNPIAIHGLANGDPSSQRFGILHL